ncbi:hypothetical protein BJ165DRAFT_1517735, partial [Panaeolus papilionaceus]
NVTAVTLNSETAQLILRLEAAQVRVRECEGPGQWDGSKGSELTVTRSSDTPRSLAPSLHPRSCTCSRQRQSRSPYSTMQAFHFPFRYFHPDLRPVVSHPPLFTPAPSFTNTLQCSAHHPHQCRAASYICALAISMRPSRVWCLVKFLMAALDVQRKGGNWWWWWWWCCVCIRGLVYKNGLRCWNQRLRVPIPYSREILFLLVLLPFLPQIT